MPSHCLQAVVRPPECHMLAILCVCVCAYVCVCVCVCVFKEHISIPLQILKEVPDGVGVGKTQTDIFFFFWWY
jgi:hypothetical protein